MRVCVVTRVSRAHSIGGMEDHTTDLALGLVRAGHEVEVIASRHPRGVEVETAAGARWRYVDAGGASFADPRWLEASAEAFLAAHRERPFDVVHGQGSSGLGLVRRGVHREVAMVEMFHGNYEAIVRASLARRRRTRGLRPLLGEAAGLARLTRRHLAAGNWYRFRAVEAIVPSAAQAPGTRRSHLLRAGRVHVVPNGVDLELFRPRPRSETRAALGLDDRLLFCCAGRLNRGKGLRHAVRALAALPPDAGDAALLVVGEGEEREPLERLALELGIGDRVLFVGPQPRERVALHLAASDVFLFPTEHNEAAGLALRQAMACGVAVVAAAAGAVPESVDRPGANGLLVPPGDAGALAAAMTALARDRSLRDRLGAAARARVEQAFGLDRMVEGALAVYRVALARRQAA